MPDHAALEAVIAAHGAQYGQRSAANFHFAMRSKVFDGVDLQGKRVLDIGCGDGRMALWTAAHGARHVVGLEPEVEGSSAGMQDAFRRVAEQAGLQDRVTLVTARLQDYDPGEERFDVLLLLASINHLDEQACMRLHFDEQARRRYHEHFRRLAALAAPGAVLVAVDADRRNLWGHLGVRNPLAPTIEWDKHQAPRLWARLLADVGFEAPRIRWGTLNTLRAPGQALLGNRLCAYALTSEFCLHMRYAGPALSAP